MNDNQNATEDRGSVSMGFLLGAALNIVQGLILFLFISGDSTYTSLLIGLGGWGLVQLIYMVPLYLYLRSQKRTNTAKGLLIAACLVLLINASCWARMWVR